MNDPAQVLAYSQADFEQPHSHFIRLYQTFFADLPRISTPPTPIYTLDLGCGSADISRRFARAYPDHVIHAVDAAVNMIKTAQQLNLENGLHQRIKLLTGRIDSICLPRPAYDVIISNSLLHHLHEPADIWRRVNTHTHSGTRVFIMDLLRPDSEQSARKLRDQYAANETEILRQDFYHSLCAAYTIAEVQTQLAGSHIDFCQTKQISDRHFIVYGTAP